MERKLTRADLRQLILEEANKTIPSGHSASSLVEPDMSKYKSEEIKALGEQINNLQNYCRIQFATIYSYIRKLDEQ